MDDIEICPPWWPHMLWKLHFPGDVLFHHDPGSPVNYPPEINRILLALVNYSSTYQIEEADVAMRLRTAAKDEVVAAAQSLGSRERT